MGFEGLLEREPPFSKGDSKFADPLPPKVARAPSNEDLRKFDLPPPPRRLSFSSELG